MAGKTAGKREKSDRNGEHSIPQLLNALQCTDVNKQQYDRARILILLILILHRISLFNPVVVSEFYSGWSRALAVFIYSYFLQIIRCTLTATFQHIIKICTFVAKEPNKNKPHEIPHPRWLQEAKPTSKPHEIHRTNTHRTVLRKEKTNETIWTLPNLIPHAVPLFISILQRFDSTYLKMNETISIFRCQRIWFHAQMIHLFHSTIVYSAPTGSSSDFSLRQILLAVLLARIANPALQSAWQECHLFPKGSVMLIRRLLNFLLALINALFLHCWRPVFHLSRHQVWCSNAATFQPAC